MRKKNKKRIDPRHFLHETVLREEQNIFTGHPGIQIGPPNSSVNNVIGALGYGDFTVTDGDPSSRVCQLGDCKVYIFADLPFKKLNSVYSELKRAKVAVEKTAATEGAPETQTFKWGPHGHGQTFYEGTIQLPMKNGQYDQAGTGTFTITLSPSAHG